jgi:hypothetical protein
LKLRGQIKLLVESWFGNALRCSINWRSSMNKFDRRLIVTRRRAPLAAATLIMFGGSGAARVGTN